MPTAQRIPPLGSPQNGSILGMSSPPPIPVWLDCDPGNDDAFAILLAACNASFRLVGISTVHGNVLLEKTTHNAVSLLDALGFVQDEIKVFPGEARPLEVKQINAADVHGESGLGGVTFPQHSRILPTRDILYLDALANAIDEYNGEICIVCVGALTNLARFTREKSTSLAKVKYVSIMGGAFGTGNITPWAEFNVFADPHAANLVFLAPELSGKIVLAPLNLTHTTLATKRVCENIYSERGENCSALRHIFSSLLNFYTSSYRQRYETFEGPPIHDPLAVFLVLAMVAREDPSYCDLASACDFHFLQRHLIVLTEGGSMGKVSFANPDADPMRKEKGGVYVGLSINAPFFWHHIYSALEFADVQIGERRTADL